MSLLLNRLSAAAAAKSLQSCPTLCDPIDGSPPGSPVPGILQAGTLEWVAYPFTRGSFWPRNWTRVSCIAGGFFTNWAIWVAQMKVKVAQLCPTLCDPMDYTLHGILQARILRWVAFPFSRGSSQPQDRTQVSCTAGGFFTKEKPPGSPRILEWVTYPFSRVSFQPRNWTRVSCIAGRFFTSWATRDTNSLIYDICFSLSDLLHCWSFSGQTRTRSTHGDFCSCFLKQFLCLIKLFQVVNIIPTVLKAKENTDPSI